jgi:hypothetical protein
MGKTTEAVNNPVEVESDSTPSIHDGEIVEISEKQHQEADVALAFIEQHGNFAYTPEQEKALVRKIDRYLMPLVRLHPDSSP